MCHLIVVSLISKNVQGGSTVGPGLRNIALRSFSSISLHFSYERPTFSDGIVLSFVKWNIDVKVTIVTA